MRIKLFTAFICGFLASICFVSAQSLTGTWTGKIEGDIGSICFDTAGYATIQTEGETIGGRKFILEGEYYYMKYEFRSVGKLIYLDFVLYDFVTNMEIRRMLGIVEFQTENKIRICVNMGSKDKRPVNFNKTEDTIVLNRVL